MGLAIKVVPVTDLGAAPEVEVYDDGAEVLDSDEVSERSVRIGCQNELRIALYSERLM